MNALLIVDVQVDFCPGGALAVPNGDKVVPVINNLLERFPLALASKDWHPADSAHFGQWPKHCMQNRPGAEFHPDLHADKIKQVFFKGTSGKDDGYSAFEATNVNLEEFLHEAGVNELYIAGLATDYCVKATALDAQKRGFKTYVIKDAIAAVNVNSGDDQKAVKEMKAKRIKFVASKDI